jgi:Enoyl-(Acyl carrier protein) reductase
MPLDPTDPHGEEVPASPSVAVLVKCPSFRKTLEERFQETRWDVVPIDDSWTWQGSASSIECAVVDFGFICFDADHDEHRVDLSAVQTLPDLVRSLLGDRVDLEGNLSSSVVTLSSRDWLGSPQNPAKAGAAASVVATSRSLALLYARRAVAVNTVCALSDSNDGDQLRPRSLLPEGVSLDGVIDAILYFANPSNRYVTGQTLNVCGGASLLSSMSV